MEEEIRGLGPEILLRLSSRLLGLRDFAAARKYARLAQCNDPTRTEPAQIIAVASVHLAAEKRLPNNLLDCYSILQVEGKPGCDTRPALMTKFKKLLILLNPSKNRFPFAQDAFRLSCDAWAVLTDPKKKFQYDNELNNDIDKPQKQENGVEKEQSNGKNKTFWTVCPYCYCLHEYEGVYLECCLRCQNCKRAFHGMAVAAPQPGIVVEGKEQYYCMLGYFPLIYSLDGSLGDKKEVSGDGDGDGFLVEKKGNHDEFKGDLEIVVEISDDSARGGKEEDCCGKNDGVGLREEMAEKWCEGVKVNARAGEEGSVLQGNDGSEVRNDVKKVMRRKSVAMNTKKLMGRGKKIRTLESRRSLGMGKVNSTMEFGTWSGGTGEESKSGSGDGSSEDDLEFLSGEHEPYVGFKNAA